MGAVRRGAATALCPKAPRDGPCFWSAAAASLRFDLPKELQHTAVLQLKNLSGQPVQAVLLGDVLGKAEPKGES